MKRKDWESTKRKWFKLNPPNHQGYYYCALCTKWITHPDLDHIKTRGGHQELAADLDNLRPVCRYCHIQRHSGKLRAEES